MVSQPIQAIEFFGGPMDGYTSIVSETPKPFVLVKRTGCTGRLSRFAQAFRRLVFRQQPPPNIVAVYELRVCGDDRIGDFAYRYVRSSIANDLQLGPATGMVGSPPV